MRLQEMLVKAYRVEIDRYQSYINAAQAIKEAIPDLPDVDGIEVAYLGVTNLELWCDRYVDVHKVTEEMRQGLHIPMSKRWADDGKIHTSLVLSPPIGPFTKIILHGWPGESCRVEKRLVGTRLVEDYEYKVICGEEKMAADHVKERVT